MKRKLNPESSRLRRRSVFVGACAVLVAAAGVVVSRAQISGGTVGVNDSVPEVLAYRGYLEKDGVPLETGIGPGPRLRFTAYAGGSARWTEEHPDVAVHGGWFEVALGSRFPFTAAMSLPNGRPLFEHPNVTLGIEVDLSGTGASYVGLSGSQPFPVGPYAMTARQAEVFDTTDTLTAAGTMTVTGSFNASNNGTLGDTTAASMTASSLSSFAPVRVVGNVAATHYTPTSGGFGWTSLPVTVSPPADGSSTTNSLTKVSYPATHTSFCALGEFRRTYGAALTSTPSSGCVVTSAIVGANTEWTLSATAKGVTAYCRMNCIDIP